MQPPFPCSRRHHVMRLWRWGFPDGDITCVMTDAVQLNASQESNNTNRIVKQLYNIPSSPLIIILIKLKLLFILLHHTKRSTCQLGRNQDCFVVAEDNEVLTTKEQLLSCQRH